MEEEKKKLSEDISALTDELANEELPQDVLPSSPKIIRLHHKVHKKIKKKRRKLRMLKAVRRSLNK
jgi:hypothetical protein